MPTLPPAQPPSGRGRESHQAREVAESFGADADRYDRARPRYPAALVDRIVAASPGPRDVLDVGCGTGIVARQFQAAGCHGARRRSRRADGRPGPASAGSRSRWRRSKTWDPPAAHSTRSSPGRPGTGWTRSPARPRRPGAAARRAAGGVLERLRAPARAGEAFAAVYRRVMPDSPFGSGAGPGQRPGRSTGAVRQGGRRDPAGGRVRRAGAVAVRLGARPTPATSGWTRCPPPAASAGSRRTSRREILAGIGAAIDAAGGSFTMQYTTVAVAAARASAA